MSSFSLSISTDSSTYPKGNPITATGKVTSDNSDVNGASFEIKSVRGGQLNAEFCPDIFGSCPKTCTTSNGECSVTGTISSIIPSGAYTIYGMTTKLGLNPDSATSIFTVEQPSGASSCSLSATPSIGVGPFSSKISVTYNNLNSVPNSIPINCGGGNTATATGCSGNTGSCSGTCNYPSVSSTTTYTASASTAGIQCSTTAVTNTPLAKACKISFSLQEIGNFDTASKTGNYVGKDYTWKIKADDASSSQCPASLTYSIPTDSIVTIGSCDKSTGIYPVSENPPSGDKISSFKVSRGKSADMFKVYVKPTTGLCTLSFGINGPDGKFVDPIFTVSTDGDVGGTCNNNAACEAGENQQSCSSDCSTKVTLGTTQLYPGSDVKITIDIKDGRYTKNDKIQLHLFIDGVIWNDELCAISSDADDNIELNPLAKPTGVSITSSDRHAVIEATCKVPDNIGVGTHKLRVIPTILPIVLPPVET